MLWPCTRASGRVLVSTTRVMHMFIESRATGPTGIYERPCADEYGENGLWNKRENVLSYRRVSVNRFFRQWQNRILSPRRERERCKVKKKTIQKTKYRKKIVINSDDKK